MASPEKESEMRGTRFDGAWAIVTFLGWALGGCATEADAASKAPDSQGGYGGSGAVSTTSSSGAPASGSSAVPSSGAGGRLSGASSAGASGTLTAGGSGTAAGATGAGAPSPNAMRDVLLVGNSVAGTVSVIDARTYENLGAVDVLPDKEEVMAAINADLVRAIAYPIVKNAQLLHHFEPAAGDRFV